MEKKSETKAKKRAERKQRYTAKTADRHHLYQIAVQNPEHEVDVIDLHFSRVRGRRALSIREDFCGTGLISCRWVESHPERTAVALDLDASVLAWGKRRNVEPMGKAAKRLRLLECNVLDAPDDIVDVVFAFNYSYFIFKTRSELVRYFASVRESLQKDGVFFLDAYGGWESYEPMEDRREEEGFDYAWQQASYNPIDSSVVNHIHFRFPDGSRMERAFTYDWRLWQLVEIREALAEAGFSRTEVLWEGEDEDGQGNGEFSPMVDVGNDPGWNAYVLALP